MNYKNIMGCIFFLFSCFVCVDYAVSFQQMKTYTVADGLLDHRVPVIFQDSMGMLWFGSEQGGVSRFDGKSIIAYAATTRKLNDRTQKIVEDKWGHIWVLNKHPVKEMGFVVIYNGHDFEYVADATSMAVDNLGHVWVGRRNSLTRYTATNRHDDPVGLQMNLNVSIDANINVIYQSHDDTLWIGGSDEFGIIIIRLEGDINGMQNLTLKRLNGLPGTLQNRTIRSITKDSDDNLWFCGPSLLLRYDGTQFEKILDTDGNSDTFQPSDGITEGAVSVKNDSQGKIWFSDNKKLHWWDGETLQKLSTLSLETNQDDYLQGSFEVEDAWGKLWFSSETGVHLYESVYIENDASGEVKSEAQRIDSSEMTHKVFRVKDGLGSDNILTIYEAIDGTIWFGHDNGVTALQPQPAIVQYGTRSILGSSSVRLMYPDSTDALWLSIPGGLARYVAKEDELYKYPLEDIVLAQGNDSQSRQYIRTTEIIEIFEAGGFIWFIDKPIQHQNGYTFYRIFRYKNEAFETLALNIQNEKSKKTSIGTHVSSGTEPWVSLNGWLFLPRSNGLHRLLPDGGTETISFDTTTSIPASADVITAMHADSQNRLLCHFETGEVKRYTLVRSNVGHQIGEIRVELLPIRSVVPIISIPDVAPTVWFYDTERKKLLHWESLDLDAPSLEISCKEDGSPLLVVQATGIPSVPEGEVRDDFNKEELVTIVFKDAIKTYHRSELKQDLPIEIREVREALSATNKDLWLATSNGAIRYNGKEVMTYRKVDGFLVDDLRYIKEDNWGNIWFATWGGGVTRYDGVKFESITTKEGLIHNNVSLIYVSDEEDLWFGTEGGATQYRVSRGALTFCRIKSVDAGKHHTGSFTSESGNPTITGLTELLPARIKHLTVGIEGINPLGGGVGYKFRLLGIDNNQWTTVSADNKETAQTIFADGVVQLFQHEEDDISGSIPRIRYERLKPGRYTLLVKAFREDWHYMKQPAVLNFTIDQPLWTRWRSVLPYLFVIGVIGSLLFHLIVNRRQAARLRFEIREKEEAEIHRIRAELNEAQNIQKGLLPTEKPEMDTFDIAGVSIPATQVGGDFFDYLTVATGQTAVVVADAAGKGLRGAMSAVLTNGMLYEVARIRSEADVILNDLNVGLAPRMYGHNFIALNLAILDESDGHVKYANGGQPFPILKRGTEVIEIECSDLPLGSRRKVSYESFSFALGEGDVLILHTDGLIEALNPEQEMYGAERFIKSVSRIPNDCSADEMIQRIVKDVQEFAEDAEQYDDLTLVVVKRTSAAE